MWGIPSLIMKRILCLTTTTTTTTKPLSQNLSKLKPIVSINLQYILSAAVLLLYLQYHSTQPYCTESKEEREIEREREREGERKEVTDGRLGVSLYMWMAVSRQMQGRNTQKQQAGGEQKWCWLIEEQLTHIHYVCVCICLLHVKLDNSLHINRCKHKQCHLGFISTPVTSLARYDSEACRRTKEMEMEM